jgi:quercetin dioxygenase-like cupin family protein
VAEETTMRHHPGRDALFASLFAAMVAGCTANEPPEVARVVLAQAIPALDGARLEVTLVEVRYAPGGGSAPHRHTCPVLGYVIEGALRTQVDGEPVQVYRAGQSFYEAPNGVHEVSANASDREPVRFTAAFVCDHATARTLPVDPIPGATP